ncbi:MAG TPA: hypothetical protein VIT21_12665, partial [Chthoniobacterales bacterium]
MKVFLILSFQVDGIQFIEAAMCKIRRTTPAKSDGVKILPRSLLLAAVSSIGFIGLTAVPESQGAVFNGGSITLIDANPIPTSPTLASSYPSTINVSGLQTIPISGNNVTLTLNNFSTTGFADDLDMLLVGPTGANLIIWSDVGAPTSTAVGPLTITLSDAAASFLPVGAALSGGTFKPTNNGADNFPSPAPSGPYGNPGPAGTATFASIFNNTNPNGSWSLYILDDTWDGNGQTMTIPSWNLTINAPVIPEP